MKLADGKSLNIQQQKSITYSGGPLLIIAGAGTGKTTVITERIKYLISQNLAKPSEILALTFTEKASQEMETRVDVALPYGTFGLWISTFHAFCDRLLRSEALDIGLLTNFRLMTDAQIQLFIKKNFWKFHLNYFRPSGNPYKFIEGLLQHFARLKDEDVSPTNYLNFVKTHFNSPEEKEEKEKYWELAKAYETYENLKIKEGVMDFTDLITNVIKLFRTRKNLLRSYHHQFKYILVDEFQDTNYAQYQLIKLLAPPTTNPNLTLVGDDSQSIYKFRGAAISNILSFMNDYPEAKQIILNTSYRCSQTILDAAYRLIKNNEPNTLEFSLGINKKLTSVRGEKGKPIEFFLTEKVEDEADQVVALIQHYKKVDRLQFKDFAILVRANNHSEPFIRALERARIPYQFLGPGMLFQKPEIKDLIAYLKVLYDFTDSASLYRVLSMDIWDIPQRDIIATINIAKKNNLSLFEQLEQIQQVNIISSSSKNKLAKFTAMVHRHQKLIPKETAGQILYYFLIDSGLLKKVINYKTENEERQAMNIMRFFDRLKSLEATKSDASIFAIVDYLDLAMSMNESPLAAEIDWSENNAVNILTVHSAKGLEFPVVFLVNLVEGRFPTRQRREQIPIPTDLVKEILPQGDYHLQEERRLFYVGMTRAKERLIFTAANYYSEGKRKTKLSLFVSEALGENGSLSTLPTVKLSQIPLFQWRQATNQDMILEKKPSSQIKIDYLSYSAIETFKTCPLHYKLKYILKVPTAPTAAQALGTSIHSALLNFYQLQLKGVQVGKTLNEQKKLLMKLLRENWSPFGYTSKDHEKQAFEKAKKYLTEYLKTDLHQKAHPLFLERSFNFRLDPSLKILGKIDRIDDIGGGKIEIIDYKTGANIPKQSDLDQDMQMTIYALAARDKGILDKKPEDVKMTFYFFDNATKVSTGRTNEQLEEAKKQLLALREEIEKSDFRCSKKAICQNCEYKILCNG